MKYDVKHKHVPIYFLLSKGKIQIYLKWEVDEKAIPFKVMNDTDHLKDLMIQDIRYIYGKVMLDSKVDTVYYRNN